MCTQPLFFRRDPGERRCSSPWEGAKSALLLSKNSWAFMINLRAFSTPGETEDPWTVIHCCKSCSRWGPSSSKAIWRSCIVSCGWQKPPMRVNIAVSSLIRVFLISVIMYHSPEAWMRHTKVSMAMYPPWRYTAPASDTSIWIGKCREQPGNHRVHAGCCWGPTVD